MIPRLQKTFIIAVALTLLAGAHLVSAQTVMTVGDVAAYALEHSREIESSVDAVEDAREDLESVFSLDNTSLSLSSGYAYNPSATSLQNSVAVDGSLNVPIIPQLSLSASLSDTIGDDRNPSGTFRVNYSPFGYPSADWRDWETFRKAEIVLASLRNTTPMRAEEAALDLVRGQLNLQSAERSMALEEQKYFIAQKRYELNDITFTELEDSRSELGGSRQHYYDTQKSLLALKKNLYQLIGPDLGDVSIDELSVDEVLLLVESRDIELVAAREGNSATINLLNRAVELEALRQQLKAPPAFRPSVSISANVNYFDFRAGTTVSVTFSPDQFQGEERADIRAAIADRELDLNLEQANLDLELRMLEQSISVAREALEISLNDYENAGVQYKETEFLLRKGERTEVELEASGLSLFSAQIRLYSAATDLYKNLGDLLLLYRNG
mgnify:CR=1 FL=1